MSDVQTWLLMSVHNIVQSNGHYNQVMVEFRVITDIYRLIKVSTSQGHKKYHVTQTRKYATRFINAQ